MTFETIKQGLKSGWKKYGKNISLKLLHVDYKYCGLISNTLLVQYFSILRIWLGWNHLFMFHNGKHDGNKGKHDGNKGKHDENIGKNDGNKGKHDGNIGKNDGNKGKHDGNKGKHDVP